LSSNFIPSLRMTQIAGEYALLFEAAVLRCILSIAGITLVMHNMSLENLSITVLNIYKNEEDKISVDIIKEIYI
jgi:hypothetical protein